MVKEKRNFKEDSSNSNLIVMRTESGKADLVNLVNEAFHDRSGLVMIEIGSYQGESAEIFLSTGKFDRIYCIDGWTNGYDELDEASQSAEDAEKAFDRRFDGEGRIFKIKGFSKDVVGMFATESVDFIYIDGCHEYESVKSDLNLYYSKVKEGGIIAGHDYNQRFNGVVHAVNEFFCHVPEYISNCGSSWMNRKPSSIKFIPTSDKELTVCMAVYNAEKYVEEAVGSILSQDFKDFNLICYDDGSTDRSLEILKSFNDKRIRIIEGNENRGGIYARTQLINAVDTKYCMWLDSDDAYCRNNALSEALSEIKSHDYDIVSFIRIFCEHKDGSTAFIEPLLYGDFEYCGNELFEKFYPLDNHFIFNSKIFKTEILKKSIPDKNVLESRFCTDDVFFGAMWFFHAKRYKNIASNQPILKYRSEIGIWGSNARNVTPKRIGELCLLQYHALISLFNRMVSIRPLTGTDIENLVHGINFPMVVRQIGDMRKKVGDEYADALAKVWHSAFAADGVHLLNGVDAFEMPKYIKYLEEMMK